MRETGRDERRVCRAVERGLWAPARLVAAVGEDDQLGKLQAKQPGAVSDATKVLQYNRAGEKNANGEPFCTDSCKVLLVGEK